VNEKQAKEIEINARKAKVMWEALKKISQEKHVYGCPDSPREYRGYCNCPDEIAAEALDEWGEKSE